MALNDSCHLLTETKHHFIQKSGGGLEPLSPIAGAATVACVGREVMQLCLPTSRRKTVLELAYSTIKLVVIKLISVLVIVYACHSIGRSYHLSARNVAANARFVKKRLALPYGIVFL